MSGRARGIVLFISGLLERSAAASSPDSHPQGHGEWQRASLGELGVERDLARVGHGLGRVHAGRRVALATPRALRWPRVGFAGAGFTGTLVVPVVHVRSACAAASIVGKRSAGARAIMRATVRASSGLHLRDDLVERGDGPGERPARDRCPR